MPLNILYLHHNGVYGGASKSLFELISAFPKDSVNAHLITPKGNLEKYSKSLNIPTITMQGCSVFDNTRLSYYRGMRWLILLREILYLPSNYLAIRKASMLWKDIDVIHVNEYLPLFSIYILKKLFGKPIVVHARSVQESKRTPFRTKMYEKFMKCFTKLTIAIDQDVSDSLPYKNNVHIIHNGLMVDTTKDIKKLNDSSFKVAIIGNLLRYKGVFEFIEAAKKLQDEGLNIQFYFVGANIRKPSLKNKVLNFVGFSEDVNQQIKYYIEDNNLNNIVFTGFIDDIRDFIPEIDINCFPSHLEAAGRSVFESAFYKVPSIVALSHPKDDTLKDGHTGICIKPHSSEELANAIRKLYFDRDMLKMLGENAYSLANSNFDIKKNAQKVLSLYQNLLKDENENNDTI